MEKVNNKLPEWISKQASLGPNIQIDEKCTAENTYWYFLTMCCPLIFEKYAIILHPFWINWKTKQLIEAGTTFEKDQAANTDFKRVSWKEFFNIYNKGFDFKSSYFTKEEIAKELRKEWPIYVWYPAEGNCENEEIKELRDNIIKLSDDQIVNYYYCLLKTSGFDDEIIYKGKLSELESLHTKEDIRDNPTAIFPDSKEWCAVADYDLPFTYVGGSSELINALTNFTKYDIYPIEPMFELK